MTTFFKHFPRINYTIDDQTRYVTDITASFILKRTYIDDAFIFQRYIVQDGETPESVSDKLYKNPKYYWILLFINGIVDPFTDWLMSSEVLEKFVQEKYPDGLTGVHHFYDTVNERICDDVDDKKYRELLGSPDFPSEIKPVTNYEYEIEENERKREILVINPKVITKFIDDFQTALEGKKV